MRIVFNCTGVPGEGGGAGRMQQHKEWMGEYAALLELESSVKDVALIAWDLPREHVPCLWWVGRGNRRIVRGRSYVPPRCCGRLWRNARASVARARD